MVKLTKFDALTISNIVQFLETAAVLGRGWSFMTDTLWCNSWHRRRLGGRVRGPPLPQWKCHQ